MQRRLVIVIVLVTVVATLAAAFGALLIASQAKCGNAALLFSGCLWAPAGGTTTQTTVPIKSSPSGGGGTTPIPGVRYSFPLTWDSGEYLVQLTLGPGKNVISCVADTGSTAVVVSAQGCKGCPR
jgi:hypothetical protein